MRVGKPAPYAPGKDFDDWDFSFNGYATYARSCRSCLAEDSETVTNSGDGDSTTRTAVRDIAVSAHDAHAERSVESREKSREQWIRGLQTVVHDVWNL